MIPTRANRALLEGHAGYRGTIDAASAVRETNRRFYEAFERRDLDAMSDLWERSDRATCTHPGWATLRGWGPIAASWFALFQGPEQLQFVLTQERVEVLGDTGWATVDENLLGSEGGTTVAALNLFVRNPSEDRWRIVCHHGSVVHSSISVEPGHASDQGDEL